MAHWIINDRGFGGVIFTCSNCGKVFRVIGRDDPGMWDKCKSCDAVLDEDHEYKEENAGRAVRKKKLEHPTVKVAKKRIELIDRILGQIDSGYLDLSDLNDSEEIELIRRLLVKHRASLIRKWL